MTRTSGFRRVETFSDDAITVRVKRIDGKLFGLIDFPSFLRPDGRFVHAAAITPRPFSEALTAAVKILPHTPFLEIVILARPDLCTV